MKIPDSECERIDVEYDEHVEWYFNMQTRMFGGSPETEEPPRRKGRRR